MTSSLKVSLRFGEWLVEKGLLNHRKLTEALSEQQVNGGRLGDVLRRLKMLDEDLVTQALAEYLSMESIKLDDASKIDMRIARLIPESIAKRYCLIAVRELDNQIIIAIADPLNIVAMDTVRMSLKRDIKVAIGTEHEIRQTIEMVYHGSDMEEQRLRDLVEIEGEEEDDIEIESEDSSVEDVNSEAASRAPVIRFVDLLLRQAIKSRASDIHIEPQEKTMSIRMRIDGVLREMVPPARKMQAAVIARIKILSDMDIAERRLPQDGRFKIRTQGRAIDMRVSVIPIIYGEKVVIRILDASAVNHNIDMLGFEPELLQLFKTSLSQPHGIIIVTGPTGSGKSTTLYSALNFLKDPTKNITTVEDPVEYRLKGINQIQVKPEIKLDFAVCLRAILRQDPDIVLIGEIRDKETLDIAMKASLTGHLVLSTFHTNDAPSTISRLLYMGAEPYLLASTLNLIVAQRLVRKICDHCREPVNISEEFLKQLKIESDKNKNFYQGKGCKYCNGTGYLGRLPVFEFFPVDNQVAEKLVAGATEAQLRALARQKGYDNLTDSGVIKMAEGLTTAEEVLRVTFIEDVGI
ncbi:GspE/PulE family protein [Planctomycetota bacterium]